MKKIVELFFLVSLMLALASCYDDEGNYSYSDLPEVTITMQDTVYATQFRTLELEADIDLNGAAENDYEYSWRIWSNDIGGVWKQKEIGNAKNLTYEVSESPGSYSLVLAVSNKKTEVTAYKQILLAVQSSITEGWMVLQEKEGKTDFDLIMSPYFSNRVQSDEIIHNVYETVNHEPLVGRGVKIGSYFCIGRYQDVTVLTDEGGVRLSATTMQKTFDISTLMPDMSSWKPENYHYWQYYFGPGRYGYDVIISNGCFYQYSDMMEFKIYTEPILKDGMTYKASPYAPKYFKHYQGILYDELGGRFLGIDSWSWVLKEMAVASEVQPFDWGNMQAHLRYMDTGYQNYEYGLFEDWNTHQISLCVFNFKNKPNIGINKYVADNCPGIQNAKYYAVGSVGPLFFYADERDIYRWDYNGTNAGEKLYTLTRADEKITGMEIFKPCVERFITSHPYNNKILIFSTYNESKKEGKIYMYYINEVNGSIDISSEKVFDGFGEILDMEYNYPKYGS